MDYKQLSKEANKAFITADHMAYVTYPLVNDLKLIVTVLENLYLSLVLGMESILNYERTFKRIHAYPDNLSVKIDTFKSKCSTRYDISRTYIVLMEEIKKVLEDYKKSSTVFKRDNRLVIMSDNLRMKSLTIEKAKQYVQGTKPLIEKINRILGQNGIPTR